VTFSRELRVGERRGRGQVLRLGVLCAAASLWHVQPAAACSREEPTEFELDPSLVGVDTAPPTRFGALQAFTRQISGTRCEGDTCTSSSCGDAGGLELKFAPPKDDHTDTAALGYRVVWLRGRMPDTMQRYIERVQPLGRASEIVLELGFSGVTQLDGELALVAVDRAGNESAPSEPVAVGWNGCMSFFNSPNRCEDGSHLNCSASGGPGRQRIGTSGLALPLLAASLAALWVRRRKSVSSRAQR